jgi:hypothetical protein
MWSAQSNVRHTDEPRVESVYSPESPYPISMDISPEIPLSSFWRDLAERFRALQATYRALRADWIYIVGSGSPGEWRLAGAESPASIQFDTLAIRAACALFPAGSSNMRDAWLEVLRTKTTSFRYEDQRVEQNDDGSEGACYLTGTILSLAGASADQCSEREGREREAETRRRFDQLRTTSHEKESDAVAQATREAEREGVKKLFPTTLGRNIDRLRRECGWSFAEMASATDVSKQLILGHVNHGRKANPATVARYANGFTDRLGRPVTVAELEGNNIPATAA